MIKVEGLTKRYARTVAVDNISFEVEKGQIVGFLGPNGAGKTTTMRVLTCFLPPTSGTAQVAGFDVLEQPIEVKKRIGYLPETPPLYPEMEVGEYLTFVGKLKGLASRRRSKASERGLRPLRHRRCENEADRQALQRLPAARGPGAGHHSQSRRADSRRADLRPRSQADHRNARADPEPGRRSHHHSQHPHSLGGGALLRARHHHQPGQAGGPRYGDQPDQPAARLRAGGARNCSAPMAL